MSVTVYVLRVRGFRPGFRYTQEWVVVFDNRGNRIVGDCGESAEAPSIRYLETVGLAARWVRYKDSVSPTEAERTYEHVNRVVKEVPEAPQPAAYKHVAFRAGIVPSRTRSAYARKGQKNA